MQWHLCINFVATMNSLKLNNRELVSNHVIKVVKECDNEKNWPLFSLGEVLTYPCKIILSNVSTKVSIDLMTQTGSYFSKKVFDVTFRLNILLWHTLAYWRSLSFCWKLLKHKSLQRSISLRKSINKNMYACVYVWKTDRKEDRH